jgi:radical SAM protein with 4Fe4S-binding SPASM domain
MLNIYLGHACNFRCSYCLQSTHADQRGTATQVDSFIERVVPFVRQNQIRDVAYWGGEPLIYWQRIEAIHEAMLAAGLSFDFVKFVTNGSLLTADHVDRLNAWNAYVVVSRHEEAGEPSWREVARLKRSSISFLFRHGHLVAWPWFEELAVLEDRYGRPFWPYVHWLRATDGCDPADYLTFDDLEVHVAHLWELAELRLSGHRHAKSALAGHLNDWRETLNVDSDAPPLCHNDRHLSVDLAGNRYTCHHNVRPFARTGELFSASGPRNSDEEDALALSRRWIDSADCRACPIRTWCRGNCHLSNTHAVDCRLSKEKHRVLAWLDAQESGASVRNLIEVS